jgi:peptidoglycan/LPS O-acetylase OafA/YrhL
MAFFDVRSIRLPSGIPPRLKSSFGGWQISKSAYPLGYLASLDGMRGLMTLAILAAHTRLDVFKGAAILMDVFFAMSGYLITSILIADYKKNGRIDFGKFYYRRFTRLYPALVTMLLCFVAVCWLFSTEFSLRLTEALVGFFYLTDYWPILGGGAVKYTQHLWSLGVEEQFYLFWPLPFALLLRRFGMSWIVVAIVLAAAAAVVALRFYLLQHTTSYFDVYLPFHTRADSLLIGCALAIALKLVTLDDYPRLANVLAYSLLPLTILILIGIFTLNHMLLSYYYVCPLLGSLAGAIAVTAAVQSKRTFMHAFFEFPPFVFCGRICYGLYLWHFPILLMIGQTQNIKLVVLVGWPLSLIMATLSYYLIERHFMRARQRWVTPEYPVNAEPAVARVAR